MAFEEMRGRPQLRLADIPKLPDATLAEIIPMVREDVRLDVNQRDVIAYPPERNESIVLFARDSIETVLFNRFDGRTAIRRIAAEAAATMSWSTDEGFARVKRLFLDLVERGVCVPSNPTR